MFMEALEKTTSVKWVGRAFQYLVLIVLSIVPGLNLVLLRGWRIKVVEKMGKNPHFFSATNFKDYLTDVIKTIGNIPIYFLKGALLWITHWLYWVPLVFFFLIFGTELFSTFWDMIVWAVKALLNYDTRSFSEATAAGKSNLLTIFVSTVVYYLVYWPIFRAGMIRYSLTGRFRCLFEFTQNILCVKQYFRYFLTACAFATTVELILFNLIVLINFVIPIVSYIIVFLVLLPAIYASTAYIYGQLARRIYTQQ